VPSTGARSAARGGCRRASRAAATAGPARRVPRATAGPAPDPGARRARGRARRSPWRRRRAGGRSSRAARRAARRGARGCTSQVEQQPEQRRVVLHGRSEHLVAHDDVVERDDQGGGCGGVGPLRRTCRGRAAPRGERCPARRRPPEGALAGDAVGAGCRQRVEQRRRRRGGCQARLQRRPRRQDGPPVQGGVRLDEREAGRAAGRGYRRPVRRAAPRVAADVGPPPPAAHEQHVVGRHTRTVEGAPQPAGEPRPRQRTVVGRLRADDDERRAGTAGRDPLHDLVHRHLVVCRSGQVDAHRQPDAAARTAQADHDQALGGHEAEQQGQGGGELRRAAEAGDGRGRGSGHGRDARARDDPGVAGGGICGQ
jgi:hypothetical protein